MQKKSLSLTVAMVLLVAVLSGCGRPVDPVPPGNGDNGDFEKIRPEALVIGTASLGGTYDVYGQAWAVLAEEALGIPVGVEETGGPVHNLIFVHNGYFMLGMTTLGPAYEAWFGRETWTWGREHRDIRALFPMYNTYFHWITDKDSGIGSLQDMDGKLVGSGPAGGTFGIAAPRIFDLLGINARLEHGGIGELMTKQLQGRLDVNGFAGGVPIPSFRAYEEERGPENVVFIGIDGQDRESVKTIWPYFADAAIPAGTYRALSEDLQTIGVWNVAIASKLLDDDMVYEIVKAVMENNEFMVQQHDAARETLVQNLDNIFFIPLHPGAIRYYRELGIEIPNHLLPPEYDPAATSSAN